MSLPQIIALFFLIIGGAYFIESLKLPLGQTSAPGAGFYPLIVGLSLTILALSLLISQRKKTEDEEIEEFPKGKDRTRVIALFITLVLFVILIKPLGYIITSVGMLTIILKIFGLKSWCRIFLISIIIAIISWYVFKKLLGVPFPPGLLTYIKIY